MTLLILTSELGGKMEATPYSGGYMHDFRLALQH